MLILLDLVQKLYYIDYLSGYVEPYGMKLIRKNKLEV